MRYGFSVTIEAGDVVRRARLAAGLSQHELALRSGVSQPHVSAYETGRRQPTVPTIARLVEATGHSLIFDLVPHATPMSLADIAPRIAADPPQARGGRWLWVREFLRGFADDAVGAKSRAALIADPPLTTGSLEWDAVLAAVAEHLAFHHNLRCPQWTLNPGRFAERAWFLSDLPTQRAWAVETSPASFRRRNLFVLRADLQVA